MSVAHTYDVLEELSQGATFNTPCEGDRHYDADIMARIHAGDQAAMRTLFGLYSPLVFSVAQRILQDHGEAEDLVQDVFSYIYHNALTYDSKRAGTRTWLVQIAASRAINRRNYLKLRGFYLRNDSSPQLALVNVDVPAVEDAIHYERQLQKVKAQINSFPYKQRRVFDLFLRRGYSLPEISEYLNESFENVRHHYYRGLKKLRMAMTATSRGS